MGNRKIIDSQSVFIKSYKLNPDLPNKFQIKLKKREFQVIKGTVYSGENKRSAGTVIEVSKVGCDNNIKKIIGYTITDEFGDYAFSIKANPNDFYELAVYTPLIS